MTWTITDNSAISPSKGMIMFTGKARTFGRALRYIVRNHPAWVSRTNIIEVGSRRVTLTEKRNLLAIK